MKHKTFSTQLKGILIGIALCGILIYLWIVPTFGKDIAEMNPEFNNAYIPWLFFLEVTGLPCYAALFFAWKIFDNIGRDNAFCKDNGRYMKWISTLALGDGIYFLLGNIILLLFSINHPGILILSLFLVFVALGISIAAAALSHLIMDAADLQEQSDYTI